MRSLRALTVSVLAAAALGCYSAPVVPPPGFFYSNTAAPIDVDSDETAMAQSMGEASSKSVLGLFAWGDCSLTAAAKDGALNTVNHVDYGFFNVLGIYQEFTTRAYGTK